MAKSSSYWYQEGTGKDLHAVDKPLLMCLIGGHVTFNDLKRLVIRKEWLDLTHERNPLPSELLVLRMRQQYAVDAAKLLRGCGWLNKLAVAKLADFLVVLFKSDDMYHERMGYLLWRCTMMAPRWLAAGFEERCVLLQEERVNYFVHEKRQDRIDHLMLGWNYLEREYANNDWITRSVDWLVEFLHTYPTKINYDEVSRLGMMSFHPEWWYPVGRGQLWDMVHGGLG